MSLILVIEDDPRIQKALHRQFTTEGYEVHVTGDGAQGLGELQELETCGRCVGPYAAEHVRPRGL